MRISGGRGGGVQFSGLLPGNSALVETPSLPVWRAFANSIVRRNRVILRTLSGGGLGNELYPRPKNLRQKPRAAKEQPTQPAPAPEESGVNQMAYMNTPPTALKANASNRDSHRILPQLTACNGKRLMSARRNPSHVAMYSYSLSQLTIGGIVAQLLRRLDRISASAANHFPGRSADEFYVGGWLRAQLS